MSTSQLLPLYQCHKQVRAAKIKEIAHKPNPDTTGRSAASSYGATITLSDDRYAKFDVSPEYVNKHEPEPGGYYVVYEDGYTSYSPAAAFESGYSPVLAMAQQNSRIESAGAMVGASASISGQQRISHREELERLLVSGASAQVAHEPNKAAAIAKGIKTVLDELAPVAPHPVAVAPLPVIERPDKLVLPEIERPDTLNLCIQKHSDERSTKTGLDLAAHDVVTGLALRGLKEVDSLAREIQCVTDKGPRVTPADIEAEIVSEHFFSAADGARSSHLISSLHFNGVPIPESLALLTFCVLVLRNGAKAVGVNYGAIDQAQHNMEFARQEARAQAVDKVYELLGFRLRDELARPVLTDADAAADLAGEPRPS